MSCPHTVQFFTVTPQSPSGVFRNLKGEGCPGILFRYFFQIKIQYNFFTSKGGGRRKGPLNTPPAVVRTVPWHMTSVCVRVDRFPWKRLPDRMCFRDVCSSDRECCRRFNICDRSARVCVDCWYGSSCTTERDCCLKYPYCQRDWRTDADGTRHVVGGKCTNEL